MKKDYVYGHNGHLQVRWDLQAIPSPDPLS